jgi:UDP-N-acetylglucosamine 2-epimerase (non-hydrolysing)
MHKAMTVVGTRPELIKLSRVISELDKSTNHILVHTGQNYASELNDVFFNELEIRKPDHFLSAAGKTAIETIGQILIKFEKVLVNEKPDSVLVYGDTNSCMAALVAKRYKIPVFHMEAGNRSFDERVPEEINRRIIDHISDINMPLTEHARNYLISEGIRPETVIKTGSCMEEVLNFYKKGIDKSNILSKLNLNKKEYFLISAHREENVDIKHRLISLLYSLNAIAEKYDQMVIFSVHPRTRKRLEEIKDIKIDDRIKFIKAVGFLDYIKLQQEATCVLSDSGTISEETSLLNLCSIMIRQAHERPEGMDETIVMMSEIDKDQILKSIDVAIDHYNNGDTEIKKVNDYNGGAISKKIVRIILSYTNYINRTVWRNY